MITSTTIPVKLYVKRGRKKEKAKKISPLCIMKIFKRRKEEI